MKEFETEEVVMGQDHEMYIIYSDAKDIRRDIVVEETPTLQISKGTEFDVDRENVKQQMQDAKNIPAGGSEWNADGWADVAAKIKGKRMIELPVEDDRIEQIMSELRAQLKND